MEIDDCESTKEMSDLSAIILTYNEEIHIERCIRSLQPIANKIFILDSFSTDHTIEIAKGLGVNVIQHKFINQADQFNWGLANIAIDTNWVMRLDADEYLETSLQNELNYLLTSLPNDISGIFVKRKIFYSGKWMRYGGSYPQIVMRIWRTGTGESEQRWMDEHIILTPGAKTIIAKHDIIDDNQKGITFWVAKHNQYASREAAEMLNLKFNLFQHDSRLLGLGDTQAKRKRKIKEGVYSKLPVGFRAFLYFCYRYFLRFGFLDGTCGFQWHFMQGYWYRMLVDIKISEIEKISGGDPDKIKKILREQHSLQI